MLSIHTRSPLSPVSTLLLLVAALAGCAGDEPPPSVVLITLDTTRADFIGAYGRRAVETPALDGLAAQGALFESAMSASAVTPVSHASILTGEFPFRHGVRVLVADGGFRLPADRPSLTRELGQRGYRTIAVQSAFPVSRRFGFERGFDVFHDLHGRVLDEEDGRAGWDMDDLQRRSDRTTDLALEELAEVEGPFFLWLHYWDPHDTRKLPPDPWIPGEPPVDREERMYWLDELYAAEVGYMDRQIGRLLDGMRDLGLYEDTLIAVTADHGEGLSDGEVDHDWRSHRMVYEEQVHVPLILRLPGVEPVGAIPDLVRTVDIAPTLYDYLGLEPPASLDGRSLRPLIEGRADTPRLGYADQVNGFDRNAHMVERRPDATFLYCVRRGDLKLTYRPHAPSTSELFDLGEDPDELTNLFDPADEETVALLEELAALQPWVLEPFEPDGSDTSGMAESLGSLGYAASTELIEATWTWFCPRHPRTRLEQPARCEECGGMPLPSLRP